MVQYFDNGDLACFDGLSFRRDKRTGYYLNSTIHKRLHVYVWEHYNGEVPKGYHIHHKDHDKNNNEIDNLVLLSAHEHQTLHGNSWSEERKEWARQNLIDNARPKASEWHGSEEGKKWHSEHAKKVFGNLPFKTFVCTYCGQEFQSRKKMKDDKNRFCSGKCSAAYRRKSGVDDIVKICERCGGEYVANKYQKTKRCPSCRRCKN